MATPSPQFLSSLYGQLASYPDPNMSGPGLPPSVSMPPPPPPPPDDAPPDAPIGPPPPPPPAMPSPPPDGGPVVPAGAPPPAGPPPPQGGDMPNDVQFAPVSSPGAPAREVPTRGPVQNALLESSFEPGVDAANQIQLRSGIQSQHESDQYELQAEHYLKQQEALERIAAQRQDQLAKLRSDYDTTIQDLGNAKIDNGRLWANMSTPDKIGATILVMLGSAFGGAQYGMSLLNDRIKQDVDQQKFDYENKLNVAKAQHTAFGMAMEQFGSEDAAYHAAMASGQLAAAAKVNSLNAQWKGTDAANQADMLRSQLYSGAAKSAAEGYRYLQPTPGGTAYRMSIRGQPIPGLVSEKAAQGYAVEHGVKPAERIDETAFKGGIDATLQAQKLGAEAAKEGKKFEVKLPNGETVNAPSEKEAGDLRELSVSATKTQRLVAEAKKIREDSTFRASIAGRAKLKQIQADLVTQFGVQNKLGALSDKDMELAVGGTADLFQFGNGVEARLDRLSREAVQARIDRVSTYPGAPPKSSGTMPGSFKPVKQ